MNPNDDDGMMLNLLPFVPREKKRKLEGSNDLKEVNQTEQKYQNKAKRAKYVDPKDFTPISSLFNKNPEIPVINQSTADGNVQEVVFSSEHVHDLPVNNHLKNNLQKQFNFKSLTLIQTMSIPPLLSCKDVLIKSPTGSGKTMCYTIPILEKLSTTKPQVTRKDGPLALVILPTRELAQQTLSVFQDLCKSCISIVPGILIGGEKCKSEKARLRKGINILVATPGRLLYHLQETSSLNVLKVSYLVLDEADKLLEMGFEKTVKDIVSIIDERGDNQRQTVLLSATLTKDVENLAMFSLKNPVYIDSVKRTDDNTSVDYTLPASLQQNFVIVPAKLRLLSLLSFITTYSLQKKQKVIVFVSSKSSACFHVEALKVFLSELKVDFSLRHVHFLHGDMNQQERFKNFELFKASDCGVLICTDVAARGLDIKKVDWIIQYSCPTVMEDYLHRVGRTARIGECGKSLLFLLPSEVGYVEHLNSANINLKEIKGNDILKQLFKCRRQQAFEEKLSDLQNTIEVVCMKSKEFQVLAIAAFTSFVQSYASYPGSLKNIFHVKKLHLGHIAKSFGLRDAPTKFANQIVAPNKQKEKRKQIGRSTLKSTNQNNDAMKDKITSGPRTKKEMKSRLKQTEVKRNIKRKNR